MFCPDFLLLDLELKVQIAMVLIDIILFHIYTYMVGKAELVTVSFSFQNFYFSGEKEVHLFLFKVMYGSFSVHPEVLVDFSRND